MTTTDEAIAQALATPRLRSPLSRLSPPIVLFAIGAVVANYLHRAAEDPGQPFNWIVAALLTALAGLNVWTGYRLESATHRLHRANLRLMAQLGLSAITALQRDR